jgi:hypothetical protein
MMAAWIQQPQMSFDDIGLQRNASDCGRVSTEAN